MNEPNAGGVDAIVAKMRSEKMSDLCIKTFLHYYERLLQGETGQISGREILPLTEVPDLEQLPDLNAEGKKALSRTVVLKLNGGLGTSMGLEKAKSLLPAKQGLSFLEILVRQVLFLRGHEAAAIPLLFMNSFNTDADTLQVLNRFPELAAGQKGLPLTFLQNRVPKIDQQSLKPAAWPQDPALEWCPPGHGDLYTALVQTGLLADMLARDCEYLFVSNADNLGATLDLNLLGYFAQSGAAFMMEAADRTEADKKGGHAARSRDGRLLLREIAQCPPEELEDFQDTRKYAYFNTNSLWIRLSALSRMMEALGNILDLPLIKNAKTVDPKDERSPKVYQLETAMGAAISLFDTAQVVRVPRTRFAPVKTTDDLLALWSDLFLLTESGAVVPNPARRLGTINVKLDPRYYKKIDDFRKRFPAGAPSLLECARVAVSGDFRFGSNVVLKGDVSLTNPGEGQKEIADGAVLAAESA